MTIRYDAPREYLFNMAPFNEETVTERVRTGLENVLSAYVDIAKLLSKSGDNNPENYELTNVSVVGSGARLNRVDSDLDFLLIAPHLDDLSAKQMKVFLAEIYFVNRPKIDALDVFVRKKDEYPDRSSIDITYQVQDLIDIYNKKLFEN